MDHRVLAAGRRHQSRRRIVAPVASVVGAASLVAAFAGGGAASAAPARSSHHAASHAQASPAVAAREGAALGKKLGKAKLPKITIGYLRYIAADPTDQADIDAVTVAAHALGWKIIACDGQGNPTVMIACGHTLLSDKINAIIDDGIPQSIIAPVLRQAAAQGLPRLTFSGTLSQHNLYSGTYTAPDALMGRMLGTWIATKLKKLPASQRQMIVQTFPSDWGMARVNGLHAVLRGSGVKIAASPSADATNLQAGTQSQISALLNGNPNVRAVWVTFDAAGTGASTAVAQKFPGKAFPNAPLVTTFYQSPITLSAIRSGQMAATVYESLGWDGFVSIDQLAEHLGHHKGFARSAQPNYGSNVQFWQPRIIDRSNVPPAGKTPPAPVNYVSFFAAKWHAEFGANTSGMARQLNPLP